jgi:hypothetical protein
MVRIQGIVKRRADSLLSGLSLRGFRARCFFSTRAQRSLSPE